MAGALADAKLDVQGAQTDVAPTNKELIVPVIVASTAWEVLWVILIVIPITICWVAAVMELLVRRRDL